MTVHWCSRRRLPPKQPRQTVPLLVTPHAPTADTQPTWADDHAPPTGPLATSAARRVTSAKCAANSQQRARHLPLAECTPTSYMSWASHPSANKHRWYRCSCTTRFVRRCMTHAGLPLTQVPRRTSWDTV